MTLLLKLGSEVFNKEKKSRIIRMKIKNMQIKNLVKRQNAESKIKINFK